MLVQTGEIYLWEWGRETDALPSQWRSFNRSLFNENLKLLHLLLHSSVFPAVNLLLFQYRQSDSYSPVRALSWRREPSGAGVLHRLTHSGEELLATAGDPLGETGGGTCGRQFALSLNEGCSIQWEEDAFRRFTSCQNSCVASDLTHLSLKQKSGALMLKTYKCRPMCCFRPTIN